MPHSVIGVALNFIETLRRLRPSLSEPPYKHPPIAPVLYLKTPNTWVTPNQPIPCPVRVPRVRMAGTLGLVIGQTACRVKAHNAFSHIAAFTIVNDVSIPHDSFYRPALRERCFDSSCSIGPTHYPPTDKPLEVNVLVNNILRCNARTSSLVRSIPQLIQDVSEFLTLRPGDILLIGEPDSSPFCAPGDKVRVEVPTLGYIENKVVAAQ